MQEYPAAESLLTERDDTLALLLLRGQPPQGALRRHSAITPCSLLHLLPLPADWETLDYADHTLVEEMLARLLQLLTCTMNPVHIDLHADFWNDRLISRLNFNLSTKLRGIDSPPSSTSPPSPRISSRSYCASASCCCNQSFPCSLHSEQKEYMFQTTFNDSLHV